MMRIEKKRNNRYQDFLKGGFALNWKSFFYGVGSGIAGGLAAFYLINKECTQTISPEKILEKVKAIFKEQGPINGSWIQMNAEPYEKDSVKYKVYKGGITKNEENNPKQYEFVADATTGTILSIRSL